MVKVRILLQRLLRRQSHIVMFQAIAAQSNRTASISARHERNVNNIFSMDNVTFGNMTKLEMIRSITMLSICAIPGFSDNATRVLEIGQYLMGSRLFSKLMRITAYGQFVAGDTVEEIQVTANNLACNNVSQMLAVPMEAPEGEHSTEREQQLDVNLSKALDCVDICRLTQIPGKQPLMHIKLTAILDFYILDEVSKKVTINEFCDYNAMQNWITTGCNQDRMVSIAPTLNEYQAKKFSAGVKRLVKIIDYAEQKGVGVMIDAEHTWINPAIQHLGISLTRTYNKLSPVVYLTYQAYLKETWELMNHHNEECKRNNAYFALKLVRGAYMHAETTRHGSHPPYMCEDWDATNRNYDKCLTDLLSMDPKRTEIIIATHNENSTRLAVELLGRRQSAGTKPNVSFAQTFGMANYISFTLGSMGYQVYKSVPYGPVEETLPYLSRRVKENHMALSGARNEMTMLRKGLRRKLSSGV